MVKQFWQQRANGINELLSRIIAAGSRKCYLDTVPINLHPPDHIDMQNHILAMLLVVFMSATTLFISGCSTISPPIKSIIAQDINGLRNALNSGVSPDYVEPMDASRDGLPGHSLVTASLWAGRADMVDLLFQRGADPHKAAMIAFPRLNRTPFRDGDESWVPALINHGVDPNDKLVGGRTPLHFTCSLPVSVEFLVRKGARVDELANLPGGRETPLGACLNEINTAQDFIKMLLASKYAASTPAIADNDIHHRDTIVKSALTLLKLGADPSAVIVRGSNKVPLIIKAYTIKQPEIAKALLDHGADVMARAEPTGESVLHVLANIGTANDVVEVIARAKIAARSKTHNPREANQVLFSWLDQLSVEGKTAMHLAGANGRMNVIQALIENGADASLRDRNGRTTQQLVAEKIERDEASVVAAKENYRRRVEKADDDARESAANRQGMLAILGSVAIAKGMSGKNYTDDQRRTVIDSYVRDRVNAADGVTTDNFGQSVNTVKRDMDLTLLSTQTRARMMEEAQEPFPSKTKSSKKTSTTSRVETASAQAKALAPTVPVRNPPSNQAAERLPSALDLSGMKKDIQLHAIKCLGTYYVTGNVPSVKGLSCYNLAYEAICPNGQTITGEANNLRAGKSSSCATMEYVYQLYPTPSCSVKELNVRVTDVQPGCK